MVEYIKREEAIDACFNGWNNNAHDCAENIRNIPAADVVKLPETGIGDLSDGFHTFNGLYEQRMILFAALVKAYKGRAWKSYRHEDGEYCFGGGWFIVGIDTPEGSYTYHYENKYWEMFDCIDLPRAKHWDGHTEKDAETCLMSLPNVAERKTGRWLKVNGYAIALVSDGETITMPTHKCSACGDSSLNVFYTNYCPKCGAKMIGGDDDV